MNRTTVGGRPAKNKPGTGSTETDDLPTPENPSRFKNGLSASEYLGKLLGIESKAAGLSIEPSQLLLSESEPGTKEDFSRPLVIELFAGSFGWSIGAIAEGFRSIGFDIEHQDYHGLIPKDATLVVKDVLELNGAWFKNASLIVASPPCQEYSWMAMPWTLAKARAKEYRTGKRDVKKLTALFDACFRIQREAIEAAGRYIPMVVENVRGAQPWLGKARWNFGSYYLWGDVPALMPLSELSQENGLTCGDVPAISTGARREGIKQHGSGREWFAGEGKISRVTSSHSKSRKAASAMIAKIPLSLARWIAKVYYIKSLTA